MMKKYEERSDIVAGYRVEGEMCITDELIDAFEGADEKGFTYFKSIATGDPEDIMKEEDMAAL